MPANAGFFFLYNFSLTFKMQLRNLVASAAVAATSLFTNVGEAAAASGYCYNTTTGGNVCITRVVGLGGNYKRVWSVVDGHYDVQDVFCNPAHRYNYKENMYGIACFQFS